MLHLFKRGDAFSRAGRVSAMRVLRAQTNLVEAPPILGL